MPLISSLISWTFSVTPRPIALCFGGTYSRISLFPIFSNVNYLKNNTPTLEIPLRESIEVYFKETLASCTKTQVEGGRQKMVSKGKGKMKEKVTKPPSSNAFVPFEINFVDNL
jgi:hypothetical protein